jgi:hypothetical protein
VSTSEPTPNPTEKTEDPNHTIPAVPKSAENITKWWKLGEILLVILGAGLFILRQLLGDWLPKAFSNYAWFITLTSVLLICLAVIFHYRRRESRDLQQATALLTESELPDDVRSNLQALLVNLARKNLIWVTTIRILSGLLIVSLIAHPIWHWATKRSPNELSIRSALYTKGTTDEQLVKDAPFLEAVYGNLNEEGAPAKMKPRILLVSTETFAHPTTRFTLQVDGGEDRLDLAGYAFRIRTDGGQVQYEPLAIRYRTPGVLSIEVPESERGDAVFFIARLSVKLADQFPTDLKRALRLTIQK